MDADAFGEGVLGERAFFAQRDESLGEVDFDNFGELLPYVFLADVERYVLDAYRAETQPSPGAPVRAIMDYLEERFVKGGEEVEELISLSFLELLPSEGEPGSGLRDLLGPELSSEAKRVA